MKQDADLRWYVVIILAVTLCFNYLDRQILSILQVPIKSEFRLSDTQLGILTGISFALLYSILGIPIARLADRINRVKIIAISLTLWSAMTALCGIAASFWQLALFRIGVGIGEAGGLAPSHSIISDYFNKTERSRGLAVFHLGSILGSALGIILGGFIAQHYGWRTAFFVCGIPGVLLALVVKFTVREPLRGAMDPTETLQDKESHAEESFKKAIESMLRNPAYLHVMIGHFVASMVGYAVVIWMPPFLSRTFSLSHSKTGVIAGGILFAGGFLGLSFGGFCSDYLAKRFGSKWLALYAAISAAVALPLNIIGFQGTSLITVIIFLGLASFFWHGQYAPSLSLIQTSVGANKRALASATAFFFSNLIGLGIGPVLVGAISDYTKSLGLAVSVMVMFLLLSSYQYCRSAHYVEVAEKSLAIDSLKKTG